jgi:glycosyltransferase involved in cell wall biosynthesis
MSRDDRTKTELFMNNLSPLFSICMPVYQGAAFINKAINSLRLQTWSDWELIIIDNASTDGTWEIIQAAASADGRIKVFRNASNIGMSENWNETLRHVRGEWIGTLAADDIYLPNALEQIYQETRDPNTALWVHAHYSVHVDGLKDLIRPFKEWRFIPMPELALLFYQRGNIFGEISCYFLSAKAVQKTVNGIGKACTYADLDFYMRLALANPQSLARYSPVVLTETTIHESSDSTRYIKLGQNLTDTIGFMENFSSCPWPFPVRLRQAVRALYCLIKFNKKFTSEQRKIAIHSVRVIIRNIF